MLPFALIHSPLVGPITWFWVAEVLRQRAHQVTVPSLAAATGLGEWSACVDAAVAAIPPQAGTVLVGHSGAGPLLPVIADRMVQPAARLIFVDAAVPPPTGMFPLVPEDFRRRLAALAVDGMLPRWSEWFGPGATERLLPDDDQRAAVIADLPELPLSYLDGRVALPPGWHHAAGAYIQLSDLYRPEAERAASYGWPVFELDGAHLDIVTRAREVATAIIEASTA